MLIRLTRTLAKRSSPVVAKRLLEKAVKWPMRKYGKIDLANIRVNLTESGHSAEVGLTIRGGTSNSTIQEYTDELKDTLINRFDPPWLFAENESAEVVAPVISDKPEERMLGTVNLDLPGDTFSRIYGRDAQIRRILDAIRIGKDTGWDKRRHTLLSGPPGCGKTELLLTLARALGNEGESWIWFDATSMTKAGAIEQMMSAKVLPPILFVEEIEKVRDIDLRWLLGVMDERGEIRRTNYRVGNQVKSVRLTVIATANNEEALGAIDSGSIYSRFGNRIECPAPDRGIMEKILIREIAEIENSNPEWVVKAMEFGFDGLGIRDCREMLNILLCGRDRLLSGEYQTDLINTLNETDRKRIGGKKIDDIKRFGIHGANKLWN